MCDKDLLCKGSCCCIPGAWEFLSGWSPGSWVWCSPSAEICVVPEGILSPAFQDSSSSLSPPSECLPCSMGWQQCFQTLEWVIQILWRGDLRHKHPGRKGQRSKVGYKAGIWVCDPFCTFRGGQHLLGIANQTSVFLWVSQSHGANPKKDLGVQVWVSDRNKLWVRERSMENTKERICFPDSKERQQKL